MIINKKKPKFFLIENVNGLLTDKFKDTFDDFVARLQLAGYDVEWKLLDAVDYGVPQNRERVFIIGFRKDLTYIIHRGSSMNMAMAGHRGNA